MCYFIFEDMKIFSPFSLPSTLTWVVRVKGASGDGRELPSCPKGPSFPDWENASAFWEFGDWGGVAGRYKGKGTTQRARKD